ncbi:AAA family ATPase [Bradyrhizobium sp. WSM1743]|uniref:AAA family ATPase n=1 Tax=Bradyrhizobium sp. WSM1743 TaxID=318996 RepID=UPI0004173245|nr:AAA family ATPase [Bradyrhizobium sp. WSM1743]
MDSDFQVLWEDDDRIFCRASRQGSDGGRKSVLAVLPAEHAPSTSRDRLAHEYALKDELDSAWALRPLELVSEGGRPVLLLEDPGGEPLERQLQAPMQVGTFLHLAVHITAALGKVHQRGLVHKDIKPHNIIVNRATGEVRLTGFGIASRLPRERQSPEPPETIAGTLAYMAPEQTGRMNRSIDARSDLYALGVTFYQMLAGAPPFTAADPMEWVHCHIARRPVPPAERRKQVPNFLSALIMKLLAKTAEERYQTAAGLESDLRRCLAAWEARQGIDDFPLGERDIPDRLLIPETLYGRAREIEVLLAAFDRMVQSGTPELVLVSGYAGIGKSAVVNELHKVLVPSRGLFADGKFDQYKRDIPYATLAQAFRSLLRGLLAKSEVELAPWRDALHKALGPNGRLLVDLVPELRLIIGEPPRVPDLALQDAQRRFHQVVRQFIGVFARPEHPLALFLDDLQWLDSATLDLLEDLLTQTDVSHLLMIGAYRDNEVDAAHPLRRKIAAIKNRSGIVEEIALAPLATEHVGQLIADSLRCEPSYAASLVQLVQEKAGGNPFFAIQFLHELVEERLLAFDHTSSCWSWDLDLIRAKGYTDHVLDLMVGKLARLPANTQAALQQLACLGNTATMTLLALVLGRSAAEVDAALWEAAHEELVERRQGYYRFTHDRVQEAAYSSKPEAERAEAHLAIGRLLAANTPTEQHGDVIFDIVNQLNRGVALITSRDEQAKLTELNLLAAKRAKVSTAYDSALTYLNAGAALLPEDCWESRHELVFSLEINRAECEFLTGALAEAERRLMALSARAAGPVELATVSCLRIDLYTRLDRSSDAIAVALDYLRHLTIDWPPHPTDEEARGEYDRVRSQLGGRRIEALIDLPLMSDPMSLATLGVLTRLLPPALFTDLNLFSLTVCRAVNLSLEHGNCDASCVAYMRLGMIAGPRFGDYEAGFRFGLLGYELVERRGLTRFHAQTYMLFGAHLAPWTRHVRSARDALLRAFDVANKTGDLTFAAYARVNLNSNLLVAGDPLAEVQREVESGLAFAKTAQFGLVVDVVVSQLQLIRTLRGLTSKFGSFDDEQFEELQTERRFAENANLMRADCWYWIRKQQARFFAGDYAAAIEASQRAQRLLWTSISQLETAEYEFYGALSLAMACASAAPAQHREYLAALAGHRRQIQIWAKNCPENFENRAALVEAEVARLEGRELDAERLYEHAIRSARANGFVQNDALANELAARFYAARGFERIARAYLADARRAYLRWGADGKVRQLDRVYAHLAEETAALGPTSTIGTPLEQLDLATVIKLSQAVSGAIVREKLLITVMRTAIEHAGAERGLLVLSHGTELRIAAEATTDGDTVVVQLRDEPVTAALLPEAILHYILRTRESIILDDAAAQKPFSADPYIIQRQARSVLGLPVIAHANFIGVLYLENNLAAHVFAPGRIAVLKLLASQAAIALENAHLYQDLAEREARIRRLVEANIIGIIIWELGGRILEANDAFLRIVGYDREDLISGRLRWTDLTPPEWLDRHMRLWIPELKMMGSVQPFEKEYFRKDGSRVPVLIGMAAFDERRDYGVSFVVDLTERKRSEEALRQSEERFRTLVQFSFDVYWESDAQHRFTRQEFGERLADAPAPGSEIGKTWWEVPYLEPDAEAWRKHRETLDAHLPFRDFELARPTPDGGKRYVSISGLPVLDNAGRFIGYRGVGRDTTERKRAEETLREVQRELAHANRLATMGELTASIAHEVSQPIAGASMNADAALHFLDRNPPAVGRARDMLGYVVNDTDRARDIIGRIRDLIKKAPPLKDRLDINEAIRGVIELARSEAVKNDVAMQTELGDGLPLVEGDRVQLQQVILNLMVNAIQAMGTVARGSRSVLITTARAESDGIIVAVKDSGPGLAPDALKRIFDPFYTTKPGGLGMGLSICRSIIEAHAGRLWVTSNAPHGATFHFTVPAHPGSAS